MVDIKEEDAAVDLCFLLDTTGSMRRFIEGVKNHIQDTVGNIVHDHPLAVINLGFVAYRDWVDEGSDHPRIEIFHFSANVGEFQQFVGKLKATGGGDYPEDVLGGLWESTQMGWSSPTRVLFHILDAPPHGRDVYHSCPGDMFPDGHHADKPLSEIFQKLQDDNVSYHMMIQGRYPLDQMVEAFNNQAHRAGYKFNVCPSIKNVSKLMKFVGKTVSKSIRPSHKPRREDRRDRPEVPMSRSSDFKVYCGIDFGTHGSAFATCTARDPRPRAGTWGGSSVGAKTLTNVLMTKKKKLVEGDDGFGCAALDRWMEMDDDEKEDHLFFRRFKMELYKDTVASDDRKEPVDIQNYLNPQDKDDKKVRTIDVLVAALKFIINQVMEKVATDYSRLYDDDIKPTDVQWILTVPAIWSQKSRKVMEKAAYRAGIPRTPGVHDQLIIALEPECACVAAQNEMHLSAGDCYMMIDCGGGTVDIACHEMVTNTSVKEIYPPSGGPWGSTYIDDVFWDKYLRELFGEAVLERAEAIDPRIKESVIQNFVSSKACASPSEATRNVSIDPLRDVICEEYGSVEAAIAHLEEVRFPSGAENSGAILKTNGRYRLIIDRRIWDYMFDSVIGKLIDHVKNLLGLPELRDKIHTLCVVGGFAMSEILMDRLRNAFEDSRKVFRPPNPMMTVVTGAAMLGLAPTTIAERCAPKTLGVAVRDLWRESDGEEKKREEPGEGYVVEGVFFPFIRAGQPIPRGGDRRAQVAHYFEPVDLKEFVVEIYQSEESDPRFVPDRPCGVIGPVRFPPDFDHNLHDICVVFDFSETLVQVRVFFGEHEAEGTSIEFLEDS